MNHPDLFSNESFFPTSPLNLARVILLKLFLENLFFFFFKTFQKHQKKFLLVSLIRSRFIMLWVCKGRREAKFVAVSSKYTESKVDTEDARKWFLVAIECFENGSVRATSTVGSVASSFANHSQMQSMWSLDGEQDGDGTAFRSSASK